MAYINPKPGTPIYGRLPAIHPSLTTGPVAPVQKNKFEETIDAMMRSETTKRWPQLTDLIQQSFKNRFEKRQAILAALDSDRGLFTRINRKIGTRSRLEIISEIVEMLREYVKVGEVEKKLYGEVMTPISLVEEMLNGLPAEVWSNPNLKWLDPCNGCGIFPAVIVKRLMEGLASWEPNEDARYKHIMEKMIHVCELQPKNMFLYLCAFDPKDAYVLNVYTGSFLDVGFDKHAKEQWGVDKFDVIVGNPPYQLQKPSFRKTQPLWHFFTKKCLEISKENGFLSTVHPSAWRNLDGIFKPLQKALLNKRILCLTIKDKSEGAAIFNAAIPFDYYTLQNRGGDTLTKIRMGDRVWTRNLRNVEFIPNGEFDVFDKIVAGPGDKTHPIVYSRSAYGHDKPHINSSKSHEFCYPCVYTVRSNSEPTLKWSAKKDQGQYGVPKVIFSNGTYGMLNDEKGEFSMSEFAAGITCRVGEGFLIKKAMETPKMRALMKAASLGNNDINRKILAAFKKDFWKEFI